MSGRTRGLRLPGVFASSACAHLTATRSALALGRNWLDSRQPQAFWLSKQSLIELEQGRGENQP
ncbi:MAG: hypothetical protein K5787_00650 [Lentisphaeria bacterium]|nr:hypothetical protein [Lentisphaeria bacterium]